MAEPNRLWRQLESTRMTTSHVPPAEAVATAGLSRAVPSAAASTATVFAGSRLLCVPAERRRSQAACTASPVGGRDAGSR
eukprot:3257944-Prymnesium_polylepis.1